MIPPIPSNNWNQKCLGQQLPPWQGRREITSPAGLGAGCAFGQQRARVPNVRSHVLHVSYKPRWLSNSW